MMSGKLRIKCWPKITLLNTVATNARIGTNNIFGGSHEITQRNAVRQQQLALK
jgi:hypothetical protein